MICLCSSLVFWPWSSWSTPNIHQYYHHHHCRPVHTHMVCMWMFFARNKKYFFTPSKKYFFYTIEEILFYPVEEILFYTVEEIFFYPVEEVLFYTVEEIFLTQKQNKTKPKQKQQKSLLTGAHTHTHVAQIRMLGRRFSRPSTLRLFLTGSFILCFWFFSFEFFSPHLGSVLLRGDKILGVRVFN